MKYSTALTRSLAEGGMRVPVLVMNEMIGIEVDEKGCGR